MPSARDLLLLAAPAASGALAQWRTAVGAVGAVLTFAAVAAAADAVDDLIGAAATRNVPRANRVRTQLIAVCGASVGLVIAFGIDVRFGDSIAGYLLVRGGYGLRSKTVPDLAKLAVPGGLLLRIIAGDYATGAYLPDPLLYTAALVAAFLALRSGSASSPTGYATVWRQQMQTLVMAGVVIGYTSWAADYAGRDVAVPLLIASVVPMLAAITRYEQLLGRLACRVRDGFLLASVGVWAGTCVIAIYFV